jgi:hypothetical protein
MISDFILSLIRTWTPIAIGTGLTWLATRLDVVLDESTTAGAAMTMVALVSGAYYLVARWLEGRVPWLSVLLATPPKVSTPTYTQLEKGN